MLNGMSEETLEIMARAGKRDLRAGMVQETWLEHTMAKTKHGKGVVNITEKPLFLLVMRIDMLREFFAPTTIMAGFSFNTCNWGDQLPRSFVYRNS